MKIVGRYWPALCWDCQHLLHFSAHEYFQFEPSPRGWRRRRPVAELLWFFDRLINIEGSATNEAVLLDPETIEWMASQPDEYGFKPPIFGHTKELNLMMMAVEVQTGKAMKRPTIPGLELRVKRKIIRTNDAVARAQARNRAKKQK